MERRRVSFVVEGIDIAGELMGGILYWLRSSALLALSL